MATKTKRKIISGVSLLCVLMLLIGIFPTGFSGNNTADAAELPSTYNASTTLYDYYTDNEINDGIPNGAALGGYQDPYTKLNAAISQSSNENVKTIIYYNNPNVWSAVGAHVYTADDKKLSTWGSSDQKMEFINGGFNINGSIYYYRIEVDVSNIIKNSSSNALLYVIFYDFNNSSDSSAQTEQISISAKYTNYCYRERVNGVYTTTVQRKVNLNHYWTDEEIKDDDYPYTYPLYFGTFFNGDYEYNYTDRDKPGYTNFYWSVNLAQRNDFQSSVRGIVNSELGDNGELLDPKTEGELPYFSKEWLEEYDVGTAYEGLNLTFKRKTGTSYYYYDSNDTSQAVYYQNGTLESGTAVKNNQTADTTAIYGFFPFNNDNDSYIDFTEDGGIGGNNPKLNMGFGMTLNIDFTLPNVTSASSAKDDYDKDIVFNFTGDDDVWVFIDNQLALDLGGAHSHASGSINFTKQTVTIEKSINLDNNNLDTIKGTNDGTVLSSNTTLTFADLGLDSIKYDGSTTHQIKFFYMERGMIESNLYIDFNLATIPNENTLTIKEQTVFDNVNAGLLSQTVKVAEKDIFSYQIQNKGTGSEDVDGSGFVYPTYTSNINRGNNETDSRNLIEDKAQLAIYQKEINNIYLDLSNDLTNSLGANNGKWNKEGVKIFAYLYSSTGSPAAVFKEMKLVDNENYVYYLNLSSLSSYDKIIFVRTRNSVTESNITWSSVYNQTPASGGYDIVSNEAYKLTGSFSSPTVSTYTYSYSSSSSQSTGDFIPDDTVLNTYQNVANVVYKVTDPFAVNTGSVGDDFTGNATNTTFTGITDSSGVMNLMYGQQSDFASQFKTDSYMKVVQNATLNTINAYGSATTEDKNGTTVTFNTSSTPRSLSTYYNTSVKAVDKNNKDVIITDNTYKYANVDVDVDDTSAVHITQTFTNTVKVGNLIVEKTLKTAETDPSKEFTFYVRLSTLFGDSNETVTDYSGVTYDIYTSTGTKVSSSNVMENITVSGTVYGMFKIKAYQKAVITGIPVQTTYALQEADDDYYEFKTWTGSSGGIITESSTETLTYNALATNDRKTGSLALVKKVKDEANEGAEITNDTTEFTFTVTLKFPEEVKKSNYNITSTPTSGTDTGDWTEVEGETNTYTKDFTVTASVDWTITNIPYGTIYTVEETSIPDNYEKETQTDTDTDTQSVIDDNNNEGKASVTIVNLKKAGTITIVKVDKDNHETKLSGAVFELYTENPDNNTNATPVKISDSTGTDGKAKFTGLSLTETYYIKETTAPSGYQIIGTAIEVGKFENGKIEIEKTVENSPITMPETGGLGSDDSNNPINYVLFGAGAITLATIAFAVLNKKIKSRRRKSSSSEEVQ